MYQRILVPIDGSNTSNRGLDEALNLAEITGASIRLVHVVDALTFATGFEPYGIYANEVIPAMREAGTRILEEGKMRAIGRDIKMDSVLFDNLGESVSDTVIKEAMDWHADLITIGTHGRRGIGRWLLGSDAEQIVRRSPIPVLLVRSTDLEQKAETAL